VISLASGRLLSFVAALLLLLTVLGPNYFFGSICLFGSRFLFAPPVSRVYLPLGSDPFMLEPASLHVSSCLSSLLFFVGPIIDRASSLSFEPSCASTSCNSKLWVSFGPLSSLFFHFLHLFSFLSSTATILSTISTSTSTAPTS